MQRTADHLIRTRQYCGQAIDYYAQSALVEPARSFAGRGRTVTVGYRLDF
ncbi:hypothetical protein LDO31_17970 [Luteimonas sp. XNQY3]|nr:hypothetical protein [Luteimonas sp. XNQY3]MCD9008087.1 hypothetical protein [Luteimonas sp. XNQY3]